jgi:hypothetical protein
MKRSIKNSFFAILIIVSLVASSIQITLAYAAGSTVEIVPLSLPADWLYGYLSGVWGPAASSIYAVGYGRPIGSNSYLPMVYHKVGNDWISSTPPLPAESGWVSGRLSGVWGASDNDVYAVGFGYNGSSTVPLLYHWNGSVWTPVSPSLSLPDGWVSGELYGIWGSNANEVYAVGFGNNGSTVLPLVYRWNGSVWTSSIPQPQLPGGWTSGNLYGVWGVSGNDVYTVGSGNNGTQNVPLLYHWDGSQWSPNPLLPPG